MIRRLEKFTHAVKSKLTCATFTLFLFSHVAFAQRGIHLPYHDTPESPSTGISGFFDTNTLPKQSFSFEFPTLGLDYGVTPNLTIGTNTLTLISAAETITSGNKLGLLFLNGKIRYRIFSSEGFSGAVSGYLMGFKFNSKDNGYTSVYVPVATLNSAYSYTDGSMGISLALAKLTAVRSTEASLDYLNSRLQGKLFSIWWRQNLGETSESELLISLCQNIYSTEQNNSSRIDRKISCLGDKYVNPLLRGTVNWRASSEWLWSAGLVWLPLLNLKIPSIGMNYMTQLFAGETHDGE